MNTNKIIQLSDEIVDLLIRLEEKKVLTPDQGDAIAIELDSIISKLLYQKNP